VGGWTLALWIVGFARLGFPSFWDPGDEAHYAQASREMLASGDWLAPTYNGQPFFDKPPLFYWLQMIAFRALGPTELAARLVPALSALLLFAATAWIARSLFRREVASLGVLILMLLPATFALSSYAIIDMTFTALLVSGASLVAISALHNRPRLQYVGYVVLALAVLAKGPVALVLTGLAGAVAFVVAPAARPSLRRLHYVRGVALILAISLPWFIYMWARFGDAFIDGYALRENVWLYTRALGDSTPGPTLSYARVLAIGLLPWTPVLLGRLVDIARGTPCDTGERWLWAWVVAVVGFFSGSSFKLDHYVYPAAPALCLLTANAWHEARTAVSRRPHLGTLTGIAFAAGTLVAAGVALARLVTALPLDLERWMMVVPVAMSAAGGLLLLNLARRGWRPPAMPIGVAAALLLGYTVMLVALLPRFESAKPVRELGRIVASTVSPSAVVGAYRMDRWNTSWRFYVDRPVEELRTKDELGAFLDGSDRELCLMLDTDFNDLLAAGLPLRIVEQRRGLFTTSGRAITRGGSAGWRTFLVVARND